MPKIEMKLLNELCDINIGRTPARAEAEYWKGKNKWLSISDLKNKYIVNTKEGITEKAIKECRMKLIPKDTVVMSFKLSLGKSAILKEAMYSNEAIASFPIKNSEKLIPEYLYYALKTVNLRKYADKAAKGVTLNKKKLNLIEIPYTTVEGQKKIVEILETAEKLVESRLSQIAAFDELTQSVFLEMFGDPQSNPKNWPKGKIKDLTASTQYGSSKKADDTNGNYPILRMNNITYKGDWNLSSLKYIDLEENEIEKYTVKKGDLLFNRTNSKELVGKTAVFRENEVYAYAGYLVRLIPNEKANSEFISAYLNSIYGKSILLNKAKNIVGMANINAKELQSIDIYLPPKLLQDEFANKVEQILIHKKKYKLALTKLDDLYNAIFQKAFKGELFQD